MHRLIVSAAVLVALIGTAAHAEEGTMRVRVGDLNLQHQDGAKVALRRIKSAATAFCGGEIVAPLAFSHPLLQRRGGHHFLDQGRGRRGHGQAPGRPRQALRG